MLLDLLLCYQLSLAMYLATRFDLLLVTCKTLLMLRSELPRIVSLEAHLPIRKASSRIVWRNHYFQYLVLFEAADHMLHGAMGWKKAGKSWPRKKLKWVVKHSKAEFTRKTPWEVVGRNAAIRSTMGTCERCCSKATDYEKTWQDQGEGALGLPLPRLLETAGLWKSAP